MSERTCEGCRWFRFDMIWQGRPHGICRRSPPVNGECETSADNGCGEWADKNITAEETERRELVRQFALAIVQGMYANPEDTSVQVAKQAQLFAREFQETMQEGQQ